MQERENISRILNESIKAVEKEDSFSLRNLSNQTIHTASISQDPDNVAIAVIVYSLSKIIERKYYGKNEWKKILIKDLAELEVAVRKKDENNFQKEIKDLKNVINKISGSFRKYIQDVFDKASINKASKIYEHGISLGRTANLLGVTMFDLAGYMGTKEFQHQSLTQTMTAKERVKLAMEMFSG